MRLPHLGQSFVVTAPALLATSQLYSARRKSQPVKLPFVLPAIVTPHFSHLVAGSVILGATSILQRQG